MSSPRTMFVELEAAANALDLCKDGSKVAVAGRSVFKIFSIEDEGFVERDNLRVGKNFNLSFSCKFNSTPPTCSYSFSFSLITSTSNCNRLGLEVRKLK